VPLHGDQREPLQQVSQVLEHYMLQSEQLDTLLVLAADDSVAAGLLIQRLPVEGEGNLAGRRNEDDIGLSEAYRRISLLAATLTREELLSLTPAQILHRLFWEETVRVFEPQHPRFACTCSRERVQNMLRGLGQAESVGLIEERGLVEVGCEFCGLQYRFDAVDVGEMFTPGRDQPPSTAAVQ
jgi:molecular chaperone Hsp33